MNKDNFADLVKSHLKEAGYSQKILANELGVNSSVLSHKLNRTGRYSLTYPEIRDIIKTLAKLEAISQKEQAQELLDVANCPAFSSEEWKTFPLKNLKEAVSPNFQTANNFKQSGVQGKVNSFTSLKTSLINLPVQLTSFVGRQREIEETRHLLSTTHLLTLAGAGGVGKTRLALQVGTNLLDSFRDGVWLTELAPITEPSLVVHEVAQALGVWSEAGRSLELTLVDYLKNKQALLIVDNCEHLLEPCSRLIIELLRHCPGLRILATSRETFEITSEVIYRVPPLSLPDFDDTASQSQVILEQLTQFEAMRLFVERAIAVRPGFRVNNLTAPALAQICYRLDGIPLAIELAAAQVSYLSVDQIMQHLDDRFRLLKGGSRVALPRHQTLRASIEWSYNLLSEEEKLVFGRLVVFAGGWTIEAAQHICGGEGVEASEVLDYLIQLVKKSLVLAEEVAIGNRIEVRYRMLETIRQYGLEKLKLAGEEAQVCLKHFNYFLKQVEETEAKLRTPEQLDRLNRLEADHDNLRVALAWAISNQHAELALRMSGSAMFFWFLKGYWVEGRKWVEATLRVEGEVSSKVRAKGLYAAGWLGVGLMDFKAAETLSQESLEISEGIGDIRGRAYAQSNLALLAYKQGDYQKALHLAEESLMVMRQVKDKYGIPHVLSTVGYSKEAQGDLVGATACFQEGIRWCQESGDKDGLAWHSFLLGRLTAREQNYEVAARLLEQSARIYDEFGNTWAMTTAINQLGAVEVELGNYERGRILHEEGLPLLRKLGEKSGLADALLRLGFLMLLQEDYAYASSLFKESLELCLQMTHKLNKERDIATCLEGLAYLASQSGKLEQAARLLDLGETLRQSVELPVLPNDHFVQERFTRLLQERFIGVVKARLETGNIVVKPSLKYVPLEQAIALALEVEPEVGEKQLNW